MATKEEILQYVRSLAEQKLITKDELTKAYDAGSGVKQAVVLTRKLSNQS